MRWGCGAPRPSVAGTGVGTGTAGWSRAQGDGDSAVYSASGRPPQPTRASVFPGRCWFSGASRSAAIACAPRHRFGGFLRKDFAEPTGRGGRTSAQIQLASVAGSCSPGSPGSSGSSQGTHRRRQSPLPERGQGTVGWPEGRLTVALSPAPPWAALGPSEAGRCGNESAWGTQNEVCVAPELSRAGFRRDSDVGLHQGSAAWSRASRLSGADNGALPGPGLRPRNGEWVGRGRGEVGIASWSSPVPAASPP